MIIVVRMSHPVFFPSQPNSIYVISAAYAISAFPFSSLKLIFNKSRIDAKKRIRYQPRTYGRRQDPWIYLILKCEFIYYFSYISQPIVFILNSQSWDAVYYQVVVGVTSSSKIFKSKTSNMYSLFIFLICTFSSICYQIFSFHAS